MNATPASTTTATARALSAAARVALALAVVALAGLCFGAGPARADEPVKGEVKAVGEAGYGRLVFKFEEPVDAKVRVAGAILVIELKRPVAVSVERLNSRLPDYISAARVDPDGKAIRIALSGRFRINPIPAADRLFIDLLPEPWVGMVPGLPQDVVDELAMRARAAELAARKQRAANKAEAMPPVRVNVVKLPTFMRYVFDLPPGVGATPELADGKYKLHFNKPVKWDLADVAATLPSTVKSAMAEAEFDGVAVVFTLNGAPETRAFREDKSFVVDIGLGADAAAPQAQAIPAMPVAAAAAPVAGQIAPPQTVPAKDDVPALKDAPQLKDAPPLKDAVAPHASAPASMPAKNIDVAAEHAAPMVEAAAKPAAKEQPKQEAAPLAKQPPKPEENAGALSALATASSDYLRVSLPFAAPTPAAMFRRGDTLWLVFDSGKPIDVSNLPREFGHVVRQAEYERGGNGEGVVRLRLVRPQLASLEADNNGWVLKIGDSVAVPPQPLTMSRTLNGNKRGIVIPLEQAGTLHQLTDPDLGTRLMVVTALAPARGVMRPQDFVELRVLQSMHGVAVQPLADDITADVTADQVAISRPGGLSLSAETIVQQQQMSPSFREGTLDPDVWDADRKAPFEARQSQLIATAAAATEGTKRLARYNLARFYLANDMGAEAKAVLSVALADKTNGGDDITGSSLKALANVMLHRPDDALKDVADPEIGNQRDAPIWRAMAQARLGQWPQAYKAFKELDKAVAALPIELQRVVLLDRMRTDIEVRDFDGAARLANDIETIGTPDELAPRLAVLKGRLAEALGQKDDALTEYRSAVMSPNRRAGSQARLREIELMSKSGAMPRNEMVHELETLTTVWRGDETETQGLQLLAHLYTEDGRYRDAFHVMRTALLAHPNSDLTRKIQDEAATTFDALFLGGKGDALPPVEALGLFYDYRELTPIGRRGDEMIRRLAERLVAVDLLDQAAELLQHQVDNRLQGAARAQVATRLATIYLMNHKPDFALAALQRTRSSELSNELRDQRLLLEARALSDVGRKDVALEVVANLKGREAVRLRADIEWSAKHWRSAGEQLELMLGDRWKDFRPLSDAERMDVLRAAIGYTLADEQIGLARLREKYAAKMAGTADAHAFEVVSAPIGAGASEFQTVARRITNTDTLDAFLRDLDTRYGADPAKSPQANIAPKADAAKADGKRAEPATTGSIRPRPALFKDQAKR
ncbi:MAG: tetratricopeptide repeat protein [Pseudolabrys sp.]|jgi:tetratricopeptide (TPR) repeat protein